MTFQLSFDFPFYGHHVRKVTVSEEGYISTAEDEKLRWGITQYIAPLMRKFNKSMSNDSFVLVQNNGTAFTVIWESVMLRDRPIYGKFTFSATLHQNGDIVFVYYQLPTLVNNIQESYPWVKIGLSDAYIFNRKERWFGRDRSIYMYHKVDLVNHNLQNSTIIRLTALPTCLGYKDCHSCMNHNTKFECAWCPAVNRCSTRNGTDPLKQNWMENGCNSTLISTSDRCPAVDPTDNSTSTQPMPTSTEVSTNNPKLNTVQLTDNKILGVAFVFLSIICLVLAAMLISFHAYRNAHKLIEYLRLHLRPSRLTRRPSESLYTAYAPVPSNVSLASVTTSSAISDATSASDVTIYE